MSEFVTGNRYLTRAEMTTNARYVCAHFRALGWTFNAIAGMLGNLECESNINPGLWEGRNEGALDRGFGLVQWTPATKYLNWCEERGLDPAHMDSALARIEWEKANGWQYYATADYPETFEQFSKSTKSPEYLASAFLWNYERAGTPREEERRTAARYWWNVITDGTTPDPDDPDEPIIDPSTPSKKRSSLPLWLLLAATRRRL